MAELAEAFNVMASRLEAAFARQRELEEARQGLIASVSHDLRTPLASLRVMVEAIADGVADDPETVRRYIAAMERETISLGKLIDDLFEMARLDAGQVTLQLEPSPIATLVLETLESMDAQAARQGVVLRSNVDRAVPPVMIDPDRIQRVLYNLIQNAIRHTPADGSVVVEVLDRGPEVQVNVRDTGEGIAEADLAPRLRSLLSRRQSALARRRWRRRPRSDHRPPPGRDPRRPDLGRPAAGGRLGLLVHVAQGRRFATIDVIHADGNRVGSAPCAPVTPLCSGVDGDLRPYPRRERTGRSPTPRAAVSLRCGISGETNRVACAIVAMCAATPTMSASRPFAWRGPGRA